MPNEEPLIPHTHDIVGVQRLKAWHEMLADFILLNPTASAKQIAEHFGVADQTVSRVRSSDLFKMYFEQRKQSFYAKVDETAVDRINRKLHGLTERAIDVLDEKIQAERMAIGIEQVRETVDMALKAVGYGSPQSGRSAIQNNVTVVVPRNALEEARVLHAQRRETLTDEIAARNDPSPARPALLSDLSPAERRETAQAIEHVMRPPSVEEIDL